MTGPAKPTRTVSVNVVEEVVYGLDVEVPADATPEQAALLVRDEFLSYDPCRLISTRGEREFVIDDEEWSELDIDRGTY